MESVAQIEEETDGYFLSENVKVLTSQFLLMTPRQT